MLLLWANAMVSHILELGVLELGDLFYLYEACCKLLFNMLVHTHVGLLSLILSIVTVRLKKRMFV